MHASCERGEQVLTKARTIRYSCGSKSQSAMFIHMLFGEDGDGGKEEGSAGFAKDTKLPTKWSKLPTFQFQAIVTATATANTDSAIRH